MSQRCHSCGRESPLGQPLQHYYGCDVDTFKSPNQDAGVLPELPEPFMELLVPAVREAWETQMRDYALAALRAAGSPAAVAALVDENAIYIEYCADLLERKGVSKRIANTLRDCAKFLRNHLTQGASR